MTLIEHQKDNIRIAEISDQSGYVITTPEDGLQLLVDTYYGGFDKLIIHEHQIIPLFFDLSTGLAGEVLQKVSNYRMQVAIVGTFDKFEGKAIHDFIYESNNGKQVAFVATVEDALTKLSS